VRQTVVCSWNVHECVGRDGRRDAARVAAVLVDIGADIVALQEVLSDTRRGGEGDQAAFLSTALSLQAIPGPTLERGGGRYGNLVLTRLPVRGVHRHDLSVPGREPRGALEVFLDAPGGGLRLVATHLGLNAAERRRQVQHLLDRLGPTLDGQALVLLGDFNEWRPWSGVVRLLKRRFGEIPAPRTFPSRRPFLALDRAWVTPRDRLAAITTEGGDRAARASDHLPLVLRLTAAGSSGIVPEKNDDRPDAPS
jgi:endonuclease/exonuclease/phosphatase family metal-dependent hydrolase